MAGGCAGRNSPAQLRAWGALQTPTPTHIHNTHNVQHTTHNTCSHFEWLNIDASWVKTYAVATLVLAKEAMQVCWPPACRQHTKLCCALCVLQYLINSLVQVLAEQSRAAGAASHLHTMKHVHTHTQIGVASLGKTKQPVPSFIDRRPLPAGARGTLRDNMDIAGGLPLVRSGYASVLVVY